MPQAKHIISRQAARKIHDRLAPTTGYLSRMLRRLDHRGCSIKDPIYTSAAQAFDGLRSLCMDLWYRSLESGVGQASPPQEGERAEDWRGENI